MEKIKSSIKHILFLTIIIFIVSTPVIAGFSPSMVGFIEEGKKVRVLIKENLSNIILTPLEDTEIFDLQGNACFKLKKGENYRLSTGSSSSSWKVQVFATHELDKAEAVKSQLLDDVNKGVKIIKSGKWYKVQLGPLSRDDAEALAVRLENQGWQNWLFLDQKKEKDREITIYKSLNEPIYKAKYLILKKKVSLNQEIYPGLLEFVNTGQGINVFNTVGFSNLLAGILAADLPGDTGVSLSNLKAKAVITRTNLFYRIFNNTGTLSFPAYHGIGGVNSLVRRSINLTLGQILKYYGELLEIDSPFRYSTDNSQKDYRQLLKEFYQQFYSRGMELLDLSKVIQQKMLVDADIRWGLKYKEIRQLTWWGPRVITILDLNLKQKGFSIEPVLAENRISGLADLADIVNKEDALAGINGGFFNYTGRPLGLFMKDGQVISESIKNRTAFGINRDGEIFIERADWQGRVSDLDESHKVRVTGVNRKPGKNEIVIINKYYGDRAPALKEGIAELLVSGGIVKQINRGGDGRRSDIPDNGYILQAHGDARSRLETFKVGDSIKFRNDFNPVWEEKGIITALGAGPTLIKDGRIFITAEDEEFQSDVVNGRAPRSALGLTDDNHLVMLTVDGRQPDLSIGISLQELAHFMQDYGIVNGMNLDGGGSARMVVRGFTMNNPSDKRFIASAILIKSK